ENASLSPAPMRAGGRATEAGIAFQAAVATWMAVHILVRMPVGGRFGINNQSFPVAIRLETGEGLDDIEVSQSDGGVIKVQCKTTANLSAGSNSALTKTVDQLVRWVADAKAACCLPDLTSNVAVLAVREDAPRTLDQLNSACRAFDLGGNWRETLRQRNQNERAALGVFETLATSFWAEHRSGVEPEDGDLMDLARIFRIARFSMDEGDFDWREASRLLGRHLFGGEVAGDKPLRDLMCIMRNLISSGAPADRDGLLRALRQRGHNDTGSPGFESDVAKLREVTERELTRLKRHSHLPIGAGLPITRESDAPLVVAMQSGSLLVVGEPGAGKTGALVHSASAIIDSGDTVVFLSVDRYSGVSIASDLASELGLRHSIVETLAAMPGPGRKILIIDALDAARAGFSAGVFVSLIEAVHEQLADDWIVVASIRTFDLKNGRRFQQFFAGTPVNERYVEPDLKTVHHFLVPRLSERDLATVGNISPELGALLEAAQPSLVDLLSNIFNLSLAAQLLADGRDPAMFSVISTQSELIDAYENYRLNRTQLQQATKVTVAEMVRRRRLTVRKVLIEHPGLDEVIQTGVLSETGDFVSFSHHVLFDHAAGHFYLEWDDPERLLSQLTGDTADAILLAPALRFAVEYLWRSDDHGGRSKFWTLVIGIFAENSIDPILGNVALRIAVENVEEEHDLDSLIKRFTTSSIDSGLVLLVERLARFAKMDIDSAQKVSLERASAWARFAETLGATGEQVLLYPVRILLQALFEHGDFANQDFFTAFGRAARALLELTWSDMPKLIELSVSAIRFVGKSFASDPMASRALLERMLHEPHFSLYADQEATWLAEQILPITRVDPEFTVKIYATLYGHKIDDSEQTWIGGRPSRILPLSSNRRQDYELCHSNLGTAMSEVLAISPYYGTRALIDALIGKVATREYGGNREPDIIHLVGNTLELRGYKIEFNEWDEQKYEDHAHDDDLLRNYVRFLRGCDMEAFEISVGAASRDYATASVWARIFGVGSERVAEIGDFLWPLIEVPDFLENIDTMRDAVRFVAAAWPSRTREDRVRFETKALDETRFADEDDLKRWHHIFGRILALLPEEMLELEAMRSLRRKLDETGFHAENLPGDQDDFVSNKMRRAGIDIESGPNQEVFEASEVLHELLDRTPSDSSASDLAALWRDSVKLIAMIDASSDLHDRLGHSAWGHISNAVERVASSRNYNPDKDGLPDLGSMIAVLERLSSSPYPERKEERNAAISWGNWDARVYAADAWVALAPRFAVEYPVIVDQIEEVLADPVSAVRLKVAQNLQVISVAAPERMWEMAERVATQESISEVLAFFLRYSMPRLIHLNLECCEVLLSIIKERLNTDFAGDDERRDHHLFEVLGSLVAQLFVWRGREFVKSWIEEWAADPVCYGDLVSAILSVLREALFRRYTQESKAESAAISDRAQQALDIILRPSIRFSAEAHLVFVSDTAESDKQAEIKKYRAAEDVIRHAMNQLYFGSGANEHDRESGVGLPAAAMVCFLDDYAEILSLFATSHEPASLYHLIKLYEFLIPADPEGVFEAIHAILVGRGKEEGYHFEFLAEALFVRIVKRYFAEYRTIFEDENCRAKLVAILRLFSDVGWPDALKLLYDLPDLLR
ncbi:MAG: ATP-binding protein, partial [Desulfobulbaceae bacterium]|nr:ATP-binding protein [Desulfobulbaceae bacterium]